VAGELGRANEGTGGYGASPGGAGFSLKPTGTVRSFLCCFFQRATRCSSMAWSFAKSGTRLAANFGSRGLTATTDMMSAPEL